MSADLADRLSGIPFLDQVLDHQPGKRLLAASRFDPTIDPCLIEHRYKGQPLVPAAVMVEMFAEAAALAAGTRRIRRLCHLEIGGGLKFFSEAAIDAHVEVRHVGGQAWCELRYDFANRKGVLLEAGRMCAGAIADLMPGDDEPLAPPLDAPVPPLRTLAYSENTSGHYLGPPFRVLKQFELKGDSGWGRLVVPPATQVAGRRTGRAWQMLPTVCDACFVACNVYTQEAFQNRLQLPHRFDELRWKRLPAEGETCTVRVRYLGQTEDRTTFDWTLYDSAGEAILDARRYGCYLLAPLEPSALPFTLN